MYYVAEFLQSRISVSMLYLSVRHLLCSRFSNFFASRYCRCSFLPFAFWRVSVTSFGRHSSSILITRLLSGLRPVGNSLHPCVRLRISTFGNHCSFPCRMLFSEPFPPLLLSSYIPLTSANTSEQRLELILYSINLILFGVIINGYLSLPPRCILPFLTSFDIPSSCCVLSPQIIQQIFVFPIIMISQICTVNLLRVF